MAIPLNDITPNHVVTGRVDTVMNSDDSVTVDLLTQQMLADRTGHWARAGRTKQRAYLE
jgi:hypothetical protein